MTAYKLVYSSDPQENKRCTKCKELIVACSCAPIALLPDKVRAVLSIEKAKRGGKTVTVVRELPAIGDYLQSLAKELKTSCGCGGTHGIEDGVGYIEIQGDKREPIRALLTKKGIMVKG